jgi:hypothetical protein
MAVFLVTRDLNKQKANYDQARLNLINHFSRYRIVFNVKGEVRPRPKWEKWKNKFEPLAFAEDRARNSKRNMKDNCAFQRARRKTKAYSASLKITASSATKLFERDQIQ